MAYRLNSFRRVLLWSSAVVGVSAALMAGPVVAQEKRAYSVDEKDLATALQKFVIDSGVDLIFSADLVEGVSANRINGVYSDEEALSEMLRSTGLGFERMSSGVLILRKLPEARKIKSSFAGEPVERQVAQTVSPPRAVVNEPEESVEIIVTGSRVVRNGFEAPTPVSVLGADELHALNQNNIASAVNMMPAFTNSMTPESNATGLSSGAAGVNQLNLRGLGTNRTLIFLDGQRVINSSLSDENMAPDVNSFPGALVERIDVVTGGASAAYGSDAIAGVVNFIIDRDFTGIKGEVLGSMTEFKDNKSYNGSLTFGTPFANGRGHFLLAGEVAHNDGIKGQSRPWLETPLLFVQNPDYTPTSGLPFYVVREEIGVGSATPGGLIVNCPGYNLTNNPCPLRGIMFGPGGTTSRFTFGQLTPQNAMIGGDWRVSRIENGVDMVPRLDRYVSYLRASYDLSDSISVYADAQWAAAHATNASSSNRRLGNVTVRDDNPFIPGSVRAQMTALNITQFSLGTFTEDLGRQYQNNYRTLRRGSVGVDGKLDAFGGEWTWNAYYQYSMTGVSSRTTHTGHTANYNRAVDSIIFNGAPTCRVNTDATTANDDPACKPLNVMGIGVNDAAAIAYISGNSYRYESLSQEIFAASASGEPFELWAGPVSLAFGAERRIEGVDGVTSATDEASGFFGGNYKRTVGSYNVTEGFIETVIPLAVGEAWAESLELNGAMRATDYSTSGYVTTWKLGGTWTPVSDVRFRVVRSRDIRAPSLGEAIGGGATGAATPVFDPFTNLNMAQVLSRKSGNPSARPEIANSLGLGAVISPTAIEGFNASVDYYKINLKGALLYPAAQTVINLCYDGNQVLCRAVSRDAQGLILEVISRPENIGAQTADGLDFETSYRFPLADINESWNGDISIRGMATRVLSLKTIRTGGSVLEGAGVIGAFGGVPGFEGLRAPKWRGNISVAYDTDPLTLRATVRYDGPGVYGTQFIECRTQCPTSTATAPTIESNHLDSFTTLDLAANYRPFEDQNVELFTTIENVTGAAPPAIGGTLTSGYFRGQDNRGYNRLGRIYRAGMRFQF